MELDVLPKNIQIEEVGERVMWGLAIELAPEGPPLVPLTEAPNEEIGTAPVQEGGTTVDDNVVEYTAFSSA